MKAKLSKYIRAAGHGEPVVITRHGHAVAAIVGPDELRTLERLRAAGLASVAGGWDDSDDLVRILEPSSRSGSRDTPSLDCPVVPYLFDTDAISEVLRPRPLQVYVDWLKTIPRAEQFTSAVTVEELFKGAFRSSARERHLHNLQQRILPAVTTLPFDVPVARVMGQIRADLERSGILLPDADLQIAATAIYHDLELVTGNIRHFERIPNVRMSHILAVARSAR